MKRKILQATTAVAVAVSCSAAAYQQQPAKRQTQPSAPAKASSTPPAKTPGTATAKTPAAAPADDKAAATRDSKYHLAMAKAHNTHANDHIRLLHKYAAVHQTVPPDVLQDHAESSQFHLQKARASYAKLRETSQGQQNLTKQLDTIDARLAKLNDMMTKLQAQNAESKAIMAHTAAITAQMAANHQDSEEVDRNFYNMDSSSYYTEGLGHFTD
jgi:hypothetical protein